MPQALEIDHEQVKIVALAIGMREAARQYCLSEATVAAWSVKEGWFAAQEAQQATIEAAKQSLRERQGLQAVSSASDILKEFGQKTRLGMAKSVNKAVEMAENMSGEALFESANNLKALAGTAALVHSWSAGSSGPSMRLDLLAQTIDLRLDGPTPEQQDIPD